MKIQLDAGHGEFRTDKNIYDPGAAGPQGTRESDIALDIVLKAGTLLKNSGFQVFYTREKDNVIDSWYNIDKVFYEDNIDMLISIHCNAFNGSAQGTETCYNPNNPEGKKLAEILQGNMIKAFPGHLDRGIKSRTDLKVCKLSFTKPAVLLETEFIDNPAQEKFLRDPANRKKIAGVIRDSVCQYYGKAAHPEETDPAPQGTAPPVPVSGVGLTQKETVKAFLNKYCKKYNLSYHEILAQALIENPNMDPEAISKSNALGIGQIKLGTAQYICKRHGINPPEKDSDLFDIEFNCQLMCLIMADMLQKAESHKYDTARLLYHDGENSIYNGENSHDAIDYNNKVVKKKEAIKNYV